MTEVFSWENKARLAWDELTAVARDGRDIYYGDLGAAIGVIALNVSRALGKIQEYCLESRIPPLTVLAINRKTGRPGEGFVAWDVDDVEAAVKLVREFNWQILANPFAGFDAETTEASLAKRLADRPATAGTIYRLVRDRGMAQRIFRSALTDVYEGKCAFCGLSFPQALDGAHILPWSECDAQQRMDPRNGILLCSTHHRMFDAKLLTPVGDMTVEYSDPHEEGGEYSASDRAISIEIHGKKMHLPQKRSLWPDVQLIQRRRAIDGW